MTAQEIGARIGNAIARDVLATPELDAEWSGIDEQDFEQMRAAGIEADTADERLSLAAARRAYDRIIGERAPQRLHCVIGAPARGDAVVCRLPNNREVRLRAGRYEVQPHNDNYWVACDSIEEALAVYAGE